MLKAEHTPASECTIRSYFDLNCHLSGNLSHGTKFFFIFGIKLWSPYLGFRDFWITLWEPVASMHRFICQPLPQTNLLHQCELPPKVLQKMDGEAELILFNLLKMWTHWEIFLRKEFFFMNFRCHWSHSDVAHLLHLSPALCPTFDRNTGVGLDYTPSGQKD